MSMTVMSVVEVNKKKQQFIVVNDNNSSLRIAMQYLPGYSCIHAKSVSTLFSKYFKSYENYKFYKTIFLKEPKFNFVEDSEQHDFTIFNQTAEGLRMPIEEMMTKIEILYQKTIEENPELFI